MLSVKVCSYGSIAYKTFFPYIWISSPTRRELISPDLGVYKALSIKQLQALKQFWFMWVKNPSPGIWMEK